MGAGGSSLKAESIKLIKYFLASLTTPEKDLWVNLSPYEKNRIVPESFAGTDMGRDLLAQDYLLKQITASLIYPEDEIGKKFWKRVYEEAAQKFGTTNIPVNTFNKVWIVPEKAVVYENPDNQTAYVVESRLKVMLEEDYLAFNKNTIPSPSVGRAREGGNRELNALGSQIIRELVIPTLTQEINRGKNFAQLRQVYNSLILAVWYKKKIKDSILQQVYIDQRKTKGIDIQDPQQQKETIYNQYLQAFKKGVYNYIKEDQDPVTRQIIPRKYFSGGVDYAMFGSETDRALEFTTDEAMASEALADHAVLVAASLDSVVDKGSVGSNNGKQDRGEEVFQRVLELFPSKYRGNSGSPIQQRIRDILQNSRDQLLFRLNKNLTLTVLLIDSNRYLKVDDVLFGRFDKLIRSNSDMNQLKRIYFMISIGIKDVEGYKIEDIVHRASLEEAQRDAGNIYLFRGQKSPLREGNNFLSPMAQKYGLEESKQAFESQINSDDPEAGIEQMILKHRAGVKPYGIPLTPDFLAAAAFSSNGGAIYYLKIDENKVINVTEKLEELKQRDHTFIDPVASLGGAHVKEFLVWHELDRNAVRDTIPYPFEESFSEVDFRPYNYIYNLIDAVERQKQTVVPLKAANSTKDTAPWLLVI